MRVLVLGAGGMLGNAVFRVFNEKRDFEVYGSVRAKSPPRIFGTDLTQNIITSCDVENSDVLIRLLSKVKPGLVINCIGLVKQLSSANEVLDAVPLNSVLPHRIAALCELAGARLIHISTDCVFSGKKGSAYFESDRPDAEDLYGRSKLLGEVASVGAITLRTSIIGHELGGNRSLIDWFLSQQGAVKGYSKAIFSGLPTVELAKIMRDFVAVNPDLHGLYHVSAKPINKYELLGLVARAYDKEILLESSEELIIDRSLDSTRFQADAGYAPPAWPELIQRMRSFK